MAYTHPQQQVPSPPPPTPQGGATQSALRTAVSSAQTNSKQWATGALIVIGLLLILFLPSFWQGDIGAPYVMGVVACAILASYIVGGKMEKALGWLILAAVVVVIIWVTGWSPAKIVDKAEGLVAVAVTSQTQSTEWRRVELEPNQPMAVAKVREGDKVYYTASGDFQVRICLEFSHGEATSKMPKTSGDQVHNFSIKFIRPNGGDNMFFVAENGCIINFKIIRNSVS